jgi:protein involved in polysaccharide export with SLBB domain
MRFVWIHSLALWLCALIGSATEAQATDVVVAGRISATRAELDSLAVRAEERASSAVTAQLRAEQQREAAALRARLRAGDFEVGDRIILVVRADSTLSDTFTVQPGRTLNLPNFPPVSLAGVLRSELRSHLVTQVARFVKDTALRATSLIRFGVLGEVAHPGYYRLPADVPISDAIMAAGGPTAQADMPKTVVRRGSKEFLSKDAVRQAMVSGMTLDQLSLSPGDEIVVRAKRQRAGWQTVAQVAALASGLVLSLRALR